MALSVNAVLRIIGVSNVKPSATIWPMPIRNGAIPVWRNVANVRAATGNRRHTSLHCAALLDGLNAMLSAKLVATVGNVLRANRKSVRRFGGLLEKTFARCVQRLPNVVVFGFPSANMHLADV